MLNTCAQVSPNYIRVVLTMHGICVHPRVDSASSRYWTKHLQIDESLTKLIHLGGVGVRSPKKVCKYIRRLCSFAFLANISVYTPGISVLYMILVYWEQVCTHSTDFCCE